MDISALSDETFDAANWINANYINYLDENSVKAKTNTEDDTAGGDSATSLAFIQSYVSKLQLYVQQVNYAVEESSQQVIANMPRITLEAANLQNDVQQLQCRINAMRDEMSAVQSETGECMETLERLNSLQTKLQATKQSLQESDGWGNLLAELEEFFERNDLQGVCEKLVALQKSVQAQEQLSGHAERQAQVEDFKNRLEALASTSVVQCFAESNQGQARNYVKIFSGIQRLPQLQQYYRAVQKNALQQQWKQSLELQAADAITTTQQQHFLTLFYDHLLEHTQRQLKWCTQIFDDEGVDNKVELLGQLQPFLVIAELLPVLQPTRDAYILQLLKTSNERLDLLGQYAEANQNFVLHLNAFLTQSNISLPADLLRQLSDAIYEYFHKFIQQYPRLEETQLATQVDRLMASQVTPGEAVRHLENSTTKIFDWLRESCVRCESITSDLALCKLIALLNGVFKRQLENFGKTQRQISLSLVGSTTTVRSENWSMLQYTMSLLQCFADFQLKLHKFENSLHARMNSLAEKLQTSVKTSSINIYRSYDRVAIQQINSSIADYQQKRSEVNATSIQSLGIFPVVYATLRTHFNETHDITLNILLQPIEAQLAHIQPPADEHAFASIAVDMPAFSFSPQECITQVGQYLLTLPQHLEPLLLAPSALLKQALEICNIKYSEATPCADVLLSLIVEQCCVLYQTQILQLKSLNAAAATQLSVDIEYLSNVIEELGLSINLHLSQILVLLKAPADDFINVSAGCEPRLVATIRQMRNIVST